MKFALVAGLVFVSMLTLEMASAQVIATPIPSGGIGAAGAAGAAGAVTMGGSAPSGVISMPSGGVSIGGARSAPPAARVVAPVPLNVQRAPVPVNAAIGGSGSCQPKSASECFAAATECLAEKKLSGQDGSPKYAASYNESGWPYIARYSDVTTTQQQDDSAADCASDVRACVTYCR